MMIVDWQEELAGLSAEQIAKGVKAIPEEWPPMVGEFKRLCLGTSTDDVHHTAAYIPFRKQGDAMALPKKADKGKAKQALANHRRMLSGQLGARERQRQLDDAKRLLFGGDHHG